MQGLHLELDPSPVRVPQGTKPAKAWAGASAVPRGPHLVRLEADWALGVIVNTNRLR